jgi:hypothetical protein
MKIQLEAQYKKLLTILTSLLYMIFRCFFFVTTALGYRVHPHPGNPERKFAAVCFFVVMVES